MVSTPCTLRPGDSRLVSLTLGAAGPMTPRTLPGTAIGLRVSPSADDALVALGVPPEALATSAAPAMSVGALCQADTWTARTLPSPARPESRTFSLRRATTGAVVTVEVG